MTTFVEDTSSWVATITALDTTTQVLGGVGGPSNTALQQLANRTAFLKILADGKAALVHTHGFADIPGLQAALDGKAPLVHVHAISDVTGLQAALDNKTPYGHTHIIADVTGLQAALDGKALASHTHGIANITGLQAALDGKAALVHTHVIGDVSGLQTTLDGKAPLVHTHPIADIINLQTTLNGKAALVHTHVIADVIGLQAALDAKGGITTTASGMGSGPNFLASAVAQMVGSGLRIVAGASGKVNVIFSGSSSASGGPTQLLSAIYYGTGASPAAKDAASGTQTLGWAYLALSGKLGFMAMATISGLTPGTTYWLDLGVLVTGAGSSCSIDPYSAFAVALP